MKVRQPVKLGYLCVTDKMDGLLKRGACATSKHIGLSSNFQIRLSNLLDVVEMQLILDIQRLLENESN